MKRLLLIMALCVTGMAAHAQNYPASTAVLLKGPTTLTNTATDSTKVTINGAKSAITFKYDISKTSGTVAGTIVLKARIVHSTLGTSTEQWATINSYTLTDATANDEVTFVANNYTDYLIVTTITGTSVTVHRKYLLYR